MIKKRASIPEIRKMVSQAIDRKQNYMDATQGEKNPQIKESRFRVEGELGVLLAIHDALNRNDLVSLRIYAEGCL